MFLFVSILLLFLCVSKNASEQRKAFQNFWYGESTWRFQFFEVFQKFILLRFEIEEQRIGGNFMEMLSSGNLRKPRQETSETKMEIFWNSVVQQFSFF